MAVYAEGDPVGYAQVGELYDPGGYAPQFEGLVDVDALGVVVLEPGLPDVGQKDVHGHHVARAGTRQVLQAATFSLGMQICAYVMYGQTCTGDISSSYGVHLRLRVTGMRRWRTSPLACVTCIVRMFRPVYRIISEKFIEQVGLSGVIFPCPWSRLDVFLG